MRLIIEIPDFVYALAKKTNIIRANIEGLEKAIIEGKPLPKGHWIKEQGSIYKCSNCRNILDFDGVNAGRGDANYCPNCGAKMEDKNEDSN